MLIGFDHSTVKAPCLKHLGFTHARTMKAEGIYWHDTKGLVDGFFHNFYRLRMHILSGDWTLHFMDRVTGKDYITRFVQFPTSDQLTDALSNFGVSEAVSYVRSQKIDSLFAS